MKHPLAHAGTICLLLVASTALAQEPETIVLRNETMQVWPADDLIARGFDVRVIPREENAAWVYLEAINTYVEMPEDLEETFKYAYTHTWLQGAPALDTYLREPGNRRAIALTRKAAAMKRCQMPCFGDPRSSILTVLLPNLSHMRFLSKLQIAEGKRLESLGRYDQAIDAYATSLRMGPHVAESFTLIESLVGIAVWSQGERAIVDLALRKPLSQAQLRKLLAVLDDRATRAPTVERGLMGDREFGPAIVDELVSKPLRFIPNLKGLFGSEYEGEGEYRVNPDPDDGWGRLEKRVGQLIYPDRCMKRHMTGFFDKLIEYYSMPPSQAARFEFDEEDYVLNRIPRWDVLSRMLLPSLSRAMALSERAQARGALARTIAAIRLYTLQHDGRPPGSLDDLEDILDASARVDPFSGGPLTYLVDGNDWVLYSVGLNLADDGGENGKRWDDLDIAHRFPPEPIEPFDSGKEDE
jgi:tetratricopeptide (TPR) repeat protein